MKSHCKALFLYFILIICALSFSCSKTVPVIQFGFIQLVQYQSDKKIEEYYSFFIIPEDEDGIDNLDELHLYNDHEQLRWIMKEGEWITFTENEKTWIGTRRIAVQEGMTLPRGVYRAVLINKGGEKGEKSFTFDYENKYKFPTLEIINDMYVINSEYPQNHLVLYDAGGNYISTIDPPLTAGSVSDLNIPQSVLTAALWAEDSEHFCSAITNVVTVR